MEGVKTVQDVWGDFTQAELEVMLFSFHTTCNTLIQRAKQDKKIHDVLGEGSPGDRARIAETGMTWRHECQERILEKQKLFEQLQDFIEQASYIADRTYTRMEWVID